MKELMKIDHTLPTKGNLKDITDIKQVDDFILITFSNGKKTLTNQTIYFDASSYHTVENIFIINGIPHAVLRNASTYTIINLMTKETVYTENFVYYIVQENHNLLRVIMQGNIKTKVYDLNSKKYVPIPKDLESYVVKEVLNNGLILLEDDNDKQKSYHDTKRAIIDRDGNIISTPIKGGIFLEGSHLFITTKDSLTVLDTNKENNEALTITKGKEVLLKPIFLTTGQIILVYKDAVRIYNFSLELLYEIPLENTDNLIDFDTAGHVIKLAFKKGSSTHHMFINYITGVSVKHDHIEGFDYWDPRVFLATDYAEGVTRYAYEYENDENIPDSTFTIYDAELNERKKFKAKFCDSAFDTNYNLYKIITYENGKRTSKVYIFDTNEIKDMNAKQINSNTSSEYSYTISKDDTITFYDRNFTPVLPPFSLKDYKLKFNNDDFSYFIQNGYLCMLIHSVNDYGGSNYRYILRSPLGDTIIDSYSAHITLIQDLIRINMNGVMLPIFINTLTGETGHLKGYIPEDNLESENTIRFAIKEYSLERKKLDSSSLYDD